MAKDHTIAYGIWKTNPSYIHLQSRYLTQFMHLFLDIPPTHFRSFSLIVSLPLSFFWCLSHTLFLYPSLKQLLSLSIYLYLPFTLRIAVILLLFLDISLSLSLSVSLAQPLTIVLFIFATLFLSFFHSCYDMIIIIIVFVFVLIIIIF